MAARPEHALRHHPSASGGPLVFPSEETVPESMQHLWLRTLLFLVLDHAYRGVHAVGCDQFVYWNAASPRRCLAPDAFVRLGGPFDLFDTWKTWERGAPELCVEIASRSDRPDPPWKSKLEKYAELGAREIVRFDWRAKEGSRLRIWDRVDERLVERVVAGDVSPCVTLGLAWVVRPLPSAPEVPALRLARDADGAGLLLTAEEAEAEARRAEAEARRAEADARRAETERADALAQRVAELEQELRRRGA
jgi:hypothetical protein